MRGELVQAARAWRRNGAVAVIAIGTLAIGIGASTAAFSVAEAILLRPLPYSNADRLVVASGELRKRNAVDLPLSGPDFLDLRRAATTTFHDFAAVQTGRRLLARADGTPEQVRVASVSPNLFRLLGGRLAIGRDFTERDGESLPDAAPHAAIIGYEYWQRRYGRRHGVLGEALSLGGSDKAHIVGVLAPGFELFFPSRLSVERVPDVWLAARIAYDEKQRATFAYRIVGRLRDDVRLDASQAEVEAVAATLRTTFPLWQSADFHIRVEPLHAYLVEQATPAIVALLGAAICLLLIACANVANLLLVRTSSRARELAVRAALGASRARVAGHVLGEALILAATGALLGTLVAWAGVGVLPLIAPAELPRLDGITIDAVALAFTAVIGVIAAVIVGILPALRGSRTDVMTVLRATGPTAGGSGQLLQNGVVVAEIALSCAVLIASGLMLRSVMALQRIEHGFEPRGLLTFELLGPKYDAAERRAAMMRNVHARLSAIPGVEGVTAASPFPLADRLYAIRWGTEEALTDPSRFQAVDYQIVLPGYFDTLKTPVIAGRAFTVADNAPDRPVVVVDEMLAAKAFPGESAVGRRILIRIRTPEPEWVEVIGVSAHQRAGSVTESGREQVFFTDGFLGHAAASRWAIRTTGDPAAYEGAVRGTVAAVGGQLAVSEIQSMDALVRRSQAGTRFAFVLIAVLACAAVLLAAIGIYGVLSTVVRQRTAEIAVRMAVGAPPGRIFALVIARGVILGLVGVIIGLLAAASFTHVMTSMLVGVEATDPVTFAVVTVLFLLIAGAASWLPGRRAAGLDPALALRAD